MFDKVNRKYENLHSFSNFSVFSELHLESSSAAFDKNKCFKKSPRIYAFSLLLSTSDSFSIIREQVKINMHKIMPNFV